MSYNILLHSDTSFVSVCSLHCFGTEWQDRNVYIIVVCLFVCFFVCLVGYLVGLTTGKVSIVPIFQNVMFWRLGPKNAIKQTTRWRYCVECPQYSIRHEALDVYFLHSTRVMSRNSIVTGCLRLADVSVMYHAVNPRPTSQKIWGVSCTECTGHGNDSEFLFPRLFSEVAD